MVRWFVLVDIVWPCATDHRHHLLDRSLNHVIFVVVDVAVADVVVVVYWYPVNDEHIGCRCCRGL